MTLEQAADAVRAYIKEKGYDGGRYSSEWLDIVDEAMAELRSELASGPVVFGNPPLWSSEE
ncbi:hypothetical protein CN085_19650 [Sinorhizobium meliloti]|uniref:hypothetical protein n=1 Tax=Rhizobium meliloti TaxID=382 RepID=UPI000FD97DD2|nr:hypothetical protein [Sinorhizobium meliloti]RVP13129.1 hypothetical protein CN085_19650 [Sinorhizobium meliloti]